MGVYLRNRKRECTCTEPCEFYSERCRWYWRKRAGGRLVTRALSKYGIKTPAQALEFEKEVKKKQLEKKWANLDPSTKTLGAFKTEYLAHRKGLNLSPHTKKQDAKALDSLESVLGASCRLRTINQRKLQDWAKILLAKSSSPFTIRSYLSHILAALNTAVDWGQLEKMPRIKKRGIVRTPDLIPRALTPQEAARILWYEKNLERRAAWRFFLWTGLRASEFVSLRWGREQAGQTQKKRYSTLNLDAPEPYAHIIGKGNKERVVPLLPPAVKALAVMERFDIGPVWRWKLNHRPDGEVSAGTVSKWFKAAARRAGIHDAHLHDLRHTAATWMAARGVAEHVIQEICGHASIITTQRYTKGMARITNLYAEMQRGLK
jgi:integrase